MIGQNVKHDSGYGHVSGESVFVDDRGETRGEVHVGIVGAPIACGELLEIKMEKALAHPDCLGIYTAKDLAHKKWGTIVHDQPILVENKIGYRDEAVAIVASRTRESLEAIKKLVECVVKETPGVFTIQEAKARGEIIYKAATPFAQGNADLAMKNAPHKLSGTFIVGGQEHFYMESQAVIAYPMEHGQIEVHASSQHPSETQRVVAETLGIPLHHVVCVVKRMGGGFGGKESQGAPIAGYAALVARRLNRPARLILTKDQDMMITGKRHPFENDWEVGFDDSGRILSLKATLQSDGGAYSDLSSSILERAMFHIDNAYYLENCWINAVCYRTNTHSNTAFRGFGGPQGAMTIEAIIEDVAAYLKIDAAEVRRVNLYRGKNVKTPYGQDLENNMLPALFDNLMKSSEYQKRRQAIDEHNKKNSGTLRGMSLTSTKFGIAFTAKFLNQGNALVNLHLDATVQVSTGATEMGQGVNTKIAQTVARALGLRMQDIQVMATSTEKNHNTSATAASSGADINCAAALEASNLIKGRLCVLAQKFFAGEKSDAILEYEVLHGKLDPDMEFKDGMVTQKSSGKTIELKKLVSMAYMNRISLGAYSHYKTPGLGFDKEKVTGRAFNYYTQGMAITEVEIDQYTGEYKMLRTDILMDLGRPINPGIDQGQVIGAYVQAMGWVTTEELYYDKGHKLISHSPTTYKIPNVQDTPRVLNVGFIKNDDNHVNVHGSKAVGEPPFLLGISAWTAIKDALRYKSKGMGLKSPATNEEVLRELSGAF
ncbi:MAG: molybdopterin-dependent oxidoreductase [Bacteriovoracaceae bacterium]|nr:molybdopterin-dependent oxidoreductase [Bacteriovoracaceae bacterium]